MPAAPGISTSGSIGDRILEELRELNREFCAIHEALRENTQVQQAIHVAIGHLLLVMTPRSSVEITQDSKGQFKPTLKLYEGSPVGHMVPQAMESYAELKMRLFQVGEDSLVNWERTVEQLERERARDEAEFDAAS